jgi:hypothetical protein
MNYLQALEQNQNEAQQKEALIKQLAAFITKERKPWQSLCECDYGCDGRMPLQGELCEYCKLKNVLREKGYIQ